jgi:hypothetical protein
MVAFETAIDAAALSQMRRSKRSPMSISRTGREGIPRGATGAYRVRLSHHEARP